MHNQLIPLSAMGHPNIASQNPTSRKCQYICSHRRRFKIKGQLACLKVSSSALETDGYDPIFYDHGGDPLSVGQF